MSLKDALPKDVTVLVVEDEPVLCEIMGAWLERLVGRVLLANNGAEALEVLAANHVDLVVTDIRMPVMDGVTLLKNIKASQKPHTHVILTTGFSDLEVRDAYDLGAEAILEKPMDRDEFLDIVKRCLMPRDELWRIPLDIVPVAVLRSSFASLDAAFKEQKIAFGRGGFCIASSQELQEGPITIHLEFQKEKCVLRGQGSVRWVRAADGLAGIELHYVSPDSRELLAKLTEGNEASAFIPASLSAQPVVAAKPA